MTAVDGVQVMPTISHREHRTPAVSMRHPTPWQCLVMFLVVPRRRLIIYWNFVVTITVAGWVGLLLLMMIRFCVVVKSKKVGKCNAGAWRRAAASVSFESILKFPLFHIKSYNFFFNFNLYEVKYYEENERAPGKGKSTSKRRNFIK